MRAINQVTDWFKFSNSYTMPFMQIRKNSCLKGIRGWTRCLQKTILKFALISINFYWNWWVSSKSPTAACVSSNSFLSMQLKILISSIFTTPSNSWRIHGNANSLNVSFEPVMSAVMLDMTLHLVWAGIAQQSLWFSNSEIDSIAVLTGTRLAYD